MVTTNMTNSTSWNTTTQMNCTSSANMTNSTSMNSTNMTAANSSMMAPNMTYANASMNATNATYAPMNFSNASHMNMSKPYVSPIKVTTKSNNKTRQETMRIVNRRTNNVTIIDGPEAAFMYIEQTHFIMTGEIKDFSKCMEYSNQTDLMIGMMTDMSEKVYGHKNKRSLKSAFTDDYAAINQMIIDGFTKCGVAPGLIMKLE